jgi:cobalt-zinc-cadmium resistance protein CzcA
VLQRRIAEIPGIEVNFSQPIRDNVNESISGQFGQIAREALRRRPRGPPGLRGEGEGVISGVTGVADLGIVKSGEVPQIRSSPTGSRSPATAWIWATSSTCSRPPSAASGRGLLGGGAQVRRGARASHRADRDDVEKIRSLRVPVEGGLTIPLSALAEVETGVGPGEHQRRERPALHRHPA